jgi:multiple sugar transport system substrate-binding protein
VNPLSTDAVEAAAAGMERFYGLPSDGYHQLLLYRTDLFAAQGLAPPDNYAAMLAAAAGTTDRENARAGWVIPTESNLVTTHQAFEQIALANGCELIDDAGEVQLLSPACREAIQFYYDIVHDYSPFGVQTDTSARNAYLAGRTGMIMAPPSVLPMIAGLDEKSPPPARSARKTAIIYAKTPASSRHSAVRDQKRHRRRTVKSGF